MEDKEIIDLLRKDPAAFGLLHNKYYKSIFSYVFRRLGDYERSRDITGETFLKAYASVHKFKWRGIPVSAWLYRIASNEINLWFRNAQYAKKWKKEMHNLPRSSRIDEEKKLIEEQAALHQEFISVQQELLYLEEHYQQVIALRFFEEKSILEICEITGKKEGTVKSLLSRGLEKLRVRMRSIATISKN